MDVQRLGAFIQKCRKDLGMTQSELGAKLNVTDKAISRWERGVGFPDVKLLEPLAEALQISVQELMQCKKMKTEQTDRELITKPVEKTQKTEKKSWIEKHRRLLALLCFLAYIVIWKMSEILSFYEQWDWLSPLVRILFFLTIVALLYASYQEDDHGIHC